MPGTFSCGKESREISPSTLSGALYSRTRPRRHGFPVIMAAVLRTVHVRTPATVATRGDPSPAYVERPLHLHAVPYRREGWSILLVFLCLGKMEININNLKGCAGHFSSYLRRRWVLSRTPRENCINRCICCRRGVGYSSRLFLVHPAKRAI